MSSVIKKIEEKYKKHHIVDVKSGDTVKVHQKIREGNKERIQIFEGLVIRTDRKGSHTGSITVRRIASGVGVEKTYLLHSPLVVKIEVTKRSKVRRNYLTYMRERTGKSARLTGVVFDRDAVNVVPDEPAPAEDNQADVDKASEKPAEKEEKPEAVDKKDAEDK
jgi:large subunit ribosomal protein L19